MSPSSRFGRLHRSDPCTDQRISIPPGLSVWLAQKALDAPVGRTLLPAPDGGQADVGLPSHILHDGTPVPCELLD